MNVRTALIVFIASMMIGCVTSSADKDGIYVIDNTTPPEVVAMYGGLHVSDIMNPESTARPELGALVTVRGVVTAVDWKGSGAAGTATERSFWVQEAECGPHNGVMFWNDILDENVIEMGVTVDATGYLVKTNGVYGIDVQTVAIHLDEPTALPAHWLTSTDTIAQFEGMLVGIQNMNITQTLDQGFELEGGLVVDNALTSFEFTPQAGGKIEAMIGVVRMDGETATLLPRTASDIAYLAAPKLIPGPTPVIDIGIPPRLGEVITPPVIDFTPVLPDVDVTEPDFMSGLCYTLDVTANTPEYVDLHIRHGLPVFVLETQVPKHYREVYEVSDPTTQGHVLVRFDDKGLSRDRLGLLWTCNGPCDTIEANITGALEGIEAKYRTQWDDVVIVNKETPENGPQVLEMDLKSQSADAKAYFSIDWREEWQKAVVCYVHVETVEELANYSKTRTVCSEVNVRTEGVEATE